MKLLLLLLSSIASANTIPVPAASTKGTPIGPFKNGDVVSIQYVSGQWSRRPQNPPESPDSTLWNELGVVIYYEDSRGIRTVIGQPKGTFLKPFQFIATEGNHFIRMNEPRESGVGVVFYEVRKNN